MIMIWNIFRRREAIAFSKKVFGSILQEDSALSKYNNAPANYYLKNVLLKPDWLVLHIYVLMLLYSTILYLNMICH